MMKYVLALLSIAMLFSCASKTEQEGLNAIAELYGGDAGYSKSFHSSLGTETIRSFNVRVSNSKRIDTLQPTVTTANIATLAFESFSEKEKKSYTHVEVELISTQNDTTSYTYPIPILHTLSQKAKTFKTFASLLVKADFKAIDGIKNDDEIPGEIGDRIGVTISEMEASYGALTNYESFGIAELGDNKGTAYQYQGYLVFGNGIRKPFFVIVDSRSGEDQMIGFRIL